MDGNAASASRAEIELSIATRGQTTAWVHPTMVHAGCHASALQHLNEVADMGTAAAKLDTTVAVQRMKAILMDDDAFGQGHIRIPKAAGHETTAS